MKAGSDAGKRFHCNSNESPLQIESRLLNEYCSFHYRLSEFIKLDLIWILLDSVVDWVMEEG